MSFIRLRERTESGWVIHADNAAFDATLCGYAYEGSCIEGEGDSGVEEMARGKINCADCLRIIWHAKGIPNRSLAEPDPKRIIHVNRNPPDVDLGRLHGHRARSARHLDTPVQDAKPDATADRRAGALPAGVPSAKKARPNSGRTSRDRGQDEDARYERWLTEIDIGFDQRSEG